MFLVSTLPSANPSAAVRLWCGLLVVCGMVLATPASAQTSTIEKNLSKQELSQRFSHLARAWHAVQPDFNFHSNAVWRLPPVSKTSSEFNAYLKALNAAESYLQLASSSETSVTHNTKTALYFAALSAWSIGKTERILPWLERLLPLHYRRPMLVGSPQAARDVSAELRHLRLAAWSDLSRHNQMPKGYTALSLLQTARTDAEIVSQDRKRRSSHKYWWLQAPTAGEMRANTLPKPLVLLADLHQHYLTKAVSQDARATRTYLFHASRTGQYEANFFIDQLQKIDDIILAAFRKEANAALSKHQYAAAKAVYRRIIDEYSGTGLEVLAEADLKKATIAEFKYVALVAIKKKRFDVAKKAYNQLIATYPEGAAAQFARGELKKLVPVAVTYFAEQGKKYWKPGEEFLKPQTKSRQFYEKAYKENPDGPRSAEMLYHWAEGRASEKGKVPEAVALLELWLKKYPEDHSMRQQAMYLLGFFYGSLAMREYQKSIDIMNEIVERWPNTPLAAECLWQIAFAHTGMADGRSEGYRKGEPYLMRYYKEYPEAPRWPNVVKWIKRFREYTLHPKQ